MLPSCQTFPNTKLSPLRSFVCYGKNDSVGSCRGMLYQKGQEYHNRCLVLSNGAFEIPQWSLSSE